MTQNNTYTVTPGLDPGVRGIRASVASDGRVKPGHDVEKTSVNSFNRAKTNG
jgi:hypothetical protein